MDLKNLKNHNLINVDHYSVDNCIVKNTPFNCWACEILKQLKQIIGKDTRNVKHFRRVCFKHGIRVTRKFEEVLILDKENGNHLWWKAIYK